VLVVSYKKCLWDRRPKTEARYRQHRASPPPCFECKRELQRSRYKNWPVPPIFTPFSQLHFYPFLLTLSIFSISEQKLLYYNDDAKRTKGMYRQRIQKVWGNTAYRGWARLLLDRVRCLIIHGPAHRPTGENDQDGHFVYNQRGGLLRCLGARSPCYCCLDSSVNTASGVPGTEGGRGRTVLEVRIGVATRTRGEGGG